MSTIDSDRLEKILNAIEGRLTAQAVAEGLDPSALRVDPFTLIAKISEAVWPLKKDQSSNGARITTDEPQPPKWEIAAAELRLKTLDRINKSCDRSNTAPSLNAIKFRERWQEIMQRQSEFEAKYC